MATLGATAVNELCECECWILVGESRHTIEIDLCGHFERSDEAEVKEGGEGGWRVARPNACSRMFVSLWGLHRHCSFKIDSAQQSSNSNSSYFGQNTGSAILMLSSCPILS